MPRLACLILLIVGINMIANSTHGDSTMHLVAGCIGAACIAIANVLVWEGINHGSRDS